MPVTKERINFNLQSFECKTILNFIKVQLHNCRFLFVWKIPVVFKCKKTDCKANDKARTKRKIFWQPLHLS